MTIYFVGPGGNNASNGKSWGTRKATLNGAEDVPVVAGDTVYIAPGVYREKLTVDVSGGAGTEVTYIADVTGEHTDGVGGVVRVTGSDNDQTATRDHWVEGSTKNYRIFRGFHFDTCTNDGFDLDNCAYWTIEDCCFQGAAADGIDADGASQSNIIIRRCFFMFQLGGNMVVFSHSGQISGNHLVENCVFNAAGSGAVYTLLVGDVTVRNCLVIGTDTEGIEASGNNAANPMVVNNCILVACSTALRAAILGELVENYNTLYANGTDRTNVAVGAQSQAYPPIFQMPLLYAGHEQSNGIRLPYWWGALSEWSAVNQIAGTSEPEEDFFGIKRPYTHGGPTASLCSWGPIQWHDFQRSDIRSYDGNLSNLVREKNAAWMFVPGISSTPTTISVRAYRTAGYGGQRSPSMVIKQPGQAPRQTVDAGAAGAWNLLTDTFTPAANPPWLTVEMRNNCNFTTTTTLSTTSTTTTTVSTVTVTTVTTTTTTLACDVWFDALRVA